LSGHITFNCCLGHKSVDAIREVRIKGLEIVDKSIDSIGENVKENICHFISLYN